jgi:serine/threonine protein kinase/Flp pilus assembly protein TadD
LDIIGKTISHYKILEKLGEGGMGVVYKAEDTKLKRTVALKFLSPQALGTEDDKTRFIHEAQAAAALNHPNICTIYEIDDAEDRPFIAMEYIEGRSLKGVIESGPLELEEAQGFAQQIVEGLQEAHRKRIVHRDIKPANIMITSEKRVKIMDFGLAKSPGRTKLTREGTTVGTVAYMSPEQARGEEVDQRTDIWSLGVVLYEMISGQVPFKGEHEQAVIYSLANEEQKPLTGLRSGVPLELERLVNRCLEKESDERYQTALDLVSDLRRIRRRIESSTQSAVSIDGQARSHRRLAWLVGALAALAVVFMLVVFPRLAGRNGVPADSGRKKLVVLPFENLGAPEDEYFADGITDEITSRLAVIKDLGVISRTSALHYKGSKKTIREIGNELNVGYVLEGTVRWEKPAPGENRVRVNPRLVRVADDSQIWSEIYDNEFKAVFDVQSRIAAEVADRLDIALTGGEQDLMNARPTENVVAYQLYLRGIDLIIYGHQPEANYRQAQQLFEQAISIDPDFATAYAKLSEAHRSLYFFGYEQTAQQLEMAKRAIDRALELDPDLPEAQRQLGYYYYQGLLDFDKALEQFSNVAKVLPNDARLLQDISYIWRRQGRLREALANQLSAFEMNPTDAGLCVEIAHTYVGLRMHEDALLYSDKAIAMAPANGWGHFLKAIVLAWGFGDIDAAQKALDLYPHRSSNELIWAQYHLALLERNFQQAHKWLDSAGDDVLRLQGSFLPVSMLRAAIYRYMGDEEQAAALLETALNILEQAARDNPEDPRIQSARGLTLGLMGKKEEAIQAGRKAVELYPVSKDVILGAERLNNLAQIYAIVGEVEHALEVIRDILSRPGIYTIHYFDMHPCFEQVHNSPGYREIREEFDHTPK